MSKFLRVRIEFPASGNQTGLTSQEISNSVRSIFLDAGINEDTVSAGVREVSLERTTPLGIDPGTAAVLVALISASIELIKLGFELEKHDREMAIKEREVTLKEKELSRKFVNEVLLPQLQRRHSISPIRVVVQLEEQ